MLDRARRHACRHGGQVSLPGGVVEPGETFEQAALREAHEEVALPLDGVRVLGALTPLDIPVSGFRLHPIVAVTNARPTLTPADGEVAHILEIGVDDLLDPATLVRHGARARRRPRTGAGISRRRPRNLGRDGDGAGRISRVAGLDGPRNGRDPLFVQCLHDVASSLHDFRRNCQRNMTAANCTACTRFSDNAHFGSRAI